MTRFGANVRRERVERSITQEKLAEMADLNIRTLQRIEAGEFGQPLGCAVVLRADVIRTFYSGFGEAFPTAHLLLHIGAASMLKAIE